MSEVTSRQLTQVCLAPGTVDGRLFARLVEDYELGFTPTSLSWSGTGRSSGRFSARALGKVAAAGSLDWARVQAGDRETFGLAGIAGHNVEQLIWERCTASDDALVAEVAALPGFNAAYRGDADDVYWQSEDSIESYELAGRPHGHLPKIAGGFFPGQDQVIDVSANPGRRTPFDGILLWASSRMWFGPRAFAHLDRERLLASPVGDITESDDGRIVIVDLFPLDWIASRHDEVRSRQRSFREWMDFDQLESRADEVAAAESDPTFEIETGTFEHGGVRRLAEWLDESGRAVPKSRAVKGRIVELSDDGRLLWQGETQRDAGTPDR